MKWKHAQSCLGLFTLLILSIAPSKSQISETFDTKERYRALAELRDTSYMWAVRGFHGVTGAIHLDVERFDREITLSVINNVLLIIGILGRVMANSAREKYANIRQDEAIKAALRVEKMRRSRCHLLYDIGSSISDRLDKWATAELQAVEIILQENKWCLALGNRSPWCQSVDAFNHKSYVTAVPYFNAAVSTVRRAFEILQCGARPGLDIASAMRFCQAYAESTAQADELCRPEEYWFVLPATNAEFCHLFCDMVESNSLREWPNWRCMHHGCLPLVRTQDPHVFKSGFFDHMYQDMLETQANSTIAMAGKNEGGAPPVSLSVGSPLWWNSWDAVLRELLPIDFLQDAVQKEILAGGDLLGSISNDLTTGFYFGSFDADTQPELMFGGVTSPLFTALGWKKAETCANLAIWLGTMRLAASGIQINNKRIKQHKGVTADARALQSLQQEASEDIQYGMCTILNAVNQLNLQGLSLVNVTAPLELKGIVGDRGGVAEGQGVDAALILDTRKELHLASARATCSERSDSKEDGEDIVEVRVFVSRSKPHLHSNHPQLLGQGFTPAGPLSQTGRGRTVASLWVKRGSSGEEVPVTRVVVTRANGGKDTSLNLSSLLERAESVFRDLVDRDGGELLQQQFMDLLRQGAIIRSGTCYNSATFGGDEGLDKHRLWDLEEDGERCQEVFDRYDLDLSGGLSLTEFTTSFWELGAVKLAKIVTTRGRNNGDSFESDSHNKASVRKAQKLYKLFGWNVWQIHEHAAPVTTVVVEKEEMMVDLAVDKETPQSLVSLHHHFCPFYGDGGDASIDTNTTCFVYLGDYETSIWLENRQFDDPEPSLPLLASQ